MNDVDRLDEEGSAYRIKLFKEISRQDRDQLLRSFEATWGEAREEQDRRGSLDSSDRRRPSVRQV